jgi:hypothetical protein
MHSTGVEPVTLGSEDRCSIQLSYECGGHELSSFSGPRPALAFSKNPRPPVGARALPKFAQNAANGGDFVLELGIGFHCAKMRVALPEVFEHLAAGDGGGGILEAAGVGVASIINLDRGGGLHPDHRIVSLQFARQRRVQIDPVSVGAFGPVGGAVDGAAVEQENLVGLGGGDLVLLLDLKAIDLPLNVAAARQVESVPSGLQRAVNLCRRLGDQGEATGLLGGEDFRNIGLTSAGAAGEDDSLHISMDRGKSRRRVNSPPSRFQVEQKQFRNGAPVLLDRGHPGVEIDRPLNHAFDGLAEQFVFLLHAFEAAVGFRVDADCFCGHGDSAGKKAKCKCGHLIEVPRTAPDAEGDIYDIAEEDNPPPRKVAKPVLALAGDSAPAVAGDRVASAGTLPYQRGPTQREKDRFSQTNLLHMPRDVYVPVALLIAGMLFYAAYFSTAYRLSNRAAGIAFVGVGMLSAFKTVLLIVFALVIAGPAGVSFGGLWTAILKLAAVAVFCDGVVSWVDYAVQRASGAPQMAGPFGLGIIGFPVALLIYWTLYVYLFGMDWHESWIVIRFLSIFDRLVRWGLFVLLLTSFRI